MRADMLTSVLTELNGTSADIQASGVISTDGLMIASVLPAGLDEDRVGAMSAAMLSLGDRTAKELARGTLEQVLIKGALGYVLMTYAGEEAVLTVMAKPNAKLGFFNKGITQQNDFSISGGDDKSKFFLSLQDVAITGTIPGDKNHRNTFRVNGTRDFGRLSVVYGVSYT